MIPRAAAFALIALVLAACGAPAPGPAAPRAGAAAASARDVDALARMAAACTAGMRPIFDAIDATPDGKLTPAEWDARCLFHLWWDTLDANADGLVHFPEFAAPEAMRALATRVLAEAADQLAAFDADADGVVEGRELAGAGAIMKEFDDDHDGQVGPGEVQRFWEGFMSGERSTVSWPPCPGPSGPRATPTRSHALRGGKVRLAWRLFLPFDPSLPGQDDR